MFSTAKEDQKDYSDESSSVTSVGWDKYGRFYVSVRIGFFLWVLNLLINFRLPSLSEKGWISPELNW